MIYRKERKRTQIPEGFFNLEDEKTKTRVSGYGHGDYIKLTDEYGNIWCGSASRNPDNSICYQFRDAQGNSLTGVSENMAITLRDVKGNTWKGFVT